LEATGSLTLLMDPFTHIKSVIAVVLGLSLAHLIQASLNLVLHPAKKKPYWIHALWVFYVFLMILHFWWWEYNLTGIKVWSFLEYIFVTLYIINFYAIAYVTFPNNIADYEDSYEIYFYSRKKWFFGFLGFSFLLDIVDTLIKGKQYFLHSGLIYDVRVVLHVLLCLLAMRINNRKFHAALVIFFILYEIVYIANSMPYIGHQ
jgi:hypothetical protein